MDVATLLEPFYEEVSEKDRHGNTCIHVAAQQCDYNILKFLARRGNL
ncbi:unnamed protein product, partial [Choristocarpus tenellus]